MPLPVHAAVCIVAFIPHFAFCILYANVNYESTLVEYFAKVEAFAKRKTHRKDTLFSPFLLLMARKKETQLSSFQRYLKCNFLVVFARVFKKLFLSASRSLPFSSFFALILRYAILKLHSKLLTQL